MNETQMEAINDCLAICIETLNSYCQLEEISFRDLMNIITNPDHVPFITAANSMIDDLSRNAAINLRKLAFGSDLRIEYDHSRITFIGNTTRTPFNLDHVGFPIAAEELRAYVLDFISTDPELFNNQNNTEPTAGAGAPHRDEADHSEDMSLYTILKDPKVFGALVMLATTFMVSPVISGSLSGFLGYKIIEKMLEGAAIGGLAGLMGGGTRGALEGYINNDSIDEIVARARSAATEQAIGNACLGAIIGPIIDDFFPGGGGPIKLYKSPSSPFHIDTARAAAIEITRVATTSPAESLAFATVLASEHMPSVRGKASASLKTRLAAHARKTQYRQALKARLATYGKSKVTSPETSSDIKLGR